jgi:hypothetical protein
MNMNAQNPFNTEQPASGERFAGRAEELDWIFHGLRERAQMFLHAPAGMGKRSLVLQAITSLVRQNLAQGAQLDLTRDTHDNELGLASLLRHLAEIRRNRETPVLVVVHNIQNVHYLTGRGERLQDELNRALEGVHKSAQLFTGDRSVSPDLVRATVAPGLRAEWARELGPVQPKSMASMIDGAFAKGGIPAAGLGTQCVQGAGPNTRDIVDLAGRTYDLSMKGRVSQNLSVEAALRVAMAERRVQARLSFGRQGKEGEAVGPRFTFDLQMRRGAQARRGVAV